MVHRLRRRVLASFVAFITGCSGGDRPADPAPSAVRDSAGVRIVENPAPSRLAWQVGAEPTLTIGATEGEHAYQLFGVEDAVRLDDGRIAVANSGTSEVRVYDEGGDHLTSWGGEGEGPGEFTGLTTLSTWPGDSVMAWDFNQNRITIFGPNGVVARTQRLTLGEGLGAGAFVGLLSDRSLVTTSLVSFEPGDRTTGLVRRSRVFARIGHDGERVSGFGEHLDEEYYVRAEVGAVLRHPFRRALHSVVWNGRVVIAPNDRYEIRAYDPQGSLTLVVRRNHSLETVTQTDVDEYVAWRLSEASPEDQAIFRRVFEGMPPVANFPAFAAVVSDAAGDLWVRDYERPPAERSVWTVFAANGEMRGLVELPPDLTVFRIGADYVLGKSVDDLGVETVEVWPLVR